MEARCVYMKIQSLRSFFSRKFQKALEDETGEPMEGTLYFTHVPSRIHRYQCRDIEGQVEDLIAIMNQYAGLHKLSLHDVSPNDSYYVRVEKGKQNEELIKNMLRAYGIRVYDVSTYTDMRDKVDFYVVTSFGRLSVQIKMRNQAKRSSKNDLGVEYARVRRGAELPLYCHRGRDRSSLADVFMCVDAVDGRIHVVPTAYIERASRQLHSQFEVQVRAESDHHTIRGVHRKTGRPLSGDGNTLTLKEPGGGQIRYFRPHCADEGLFKALFYMPIPTKWEHCFHPN